MSEIVQYILLLLYRCIRPIIKGTLRRFTKLCELQRICYGLKSGAPRTKAVEKSLSLSKNESLRSILTCTRDQSFRNSLEAAVRTTLNAKKINPKVHSQFPRAYGKCLEQIWSYSMLVEDLENLRKVQYDSSNAEHEEKLLSLWETLVPHQPLEARVTKQWQDIGFQGDDPKTDFRGMGILGLDNLIYFSKEHTSIAQRILRRSHHPKYGYAFAIVGINITHMAFLLVTSGAAKTHIYNITRSPASIRVFHQMYCYLFVEFDKLWLKSNPSNIMDFSAIRDKFENSVREKLKNVDTCFKLVAVDDV